MHIPLSSIVLLSIVVIGCQPDRDKALEVTNGGATASLPASVPTGTVTWNDTCSLGESGADWIQSQVAALKSNQKSAAADWFTQCFCAQINSLKGAVTCPTSLQDPLSTPADFYCKLLPTLQGLCAGTETTLDTSKCFKKKTTKNPKTQRTITTYPTTPWYNQNIFNPLIVHDQAGNRRTAPDLALGPNFTLVQDDSAADLCKNGDSSKYSDCNAISAIHANPAYAYNCGKINIGNDPVFNMATCSTQLWGPKDDRTIFIGGPNSNAIVHSCISKSGIDSYNTACPPAQGLSADTLPISETPTSPKNTLAPPCQSQYNTINAVSYGAAVCDACDGYKGNTGDQANCTGAISDHCKRYKNCYTNNAGIHCSHLSPYKTCEFRTGATVPGKCKCSSSSTDAGCKE